MADRTDTTRQPGFYWVVLNNDEMTIGQYRIRKGDGGWWIVGSDEEGTDTMIKRVLEGPLEEPPVRSEP